MNKFKLFILMMFCTLSCGLTAAYGQNITGTVIDNEGEPVIGASVIVEKSSVGTATDIDGKFSLAVSKLPANLKISSIGYEPKTVKVTSYGHIDVTLESNTNTLDEVVVVGYGVVRKADLAGSVSVLDSKSFQAQPILTLGEAIQGRVSGVNVIPSGVPGEAPKIRVRGSNSINKSNEPLYVVDGLVRESGLEGINPEDVASMQILKDASSTAIYGSRGANGVVIITTKGGRKGETNITFDASFGWSNATHMPKVMSTEQYARALADYGNIPEDDLTEYLDGSNPGVDWIDAITRTGISQNYKLNFSKGTEGMQMYISANYMNDKGILEDSSYERFAARANINADLTKWLSVTADVNLSHGNGHGVGSFSGTAAGPLYFAFTTSPSMNMYEADGITFAADQYNSITPRNPYSQITANNERRMDIVNGHFDIKFKICKGLTFTTSNGVDYRNNYNYSFTPTTANPGATSGMSNLNRNRWLLQTTNNFTYVGTFAEKHNLTATAVWEATSSNTRMMSISGTDLMTESVGWWNVGNAQTKDANNSYSKWTLLSAVARAIYNYDNRYMLTATFRADGSSRLQNNKWAYFPSVAAAWTISNEKFMEPASPWLSNMKLRASWGIIGNQDISPYQTLELLTGTSTYYNSATAQPGYWSNQMPTPDLKWEKTKQVDVGLDMGFLNGRLDVTLDWYYKRTYDALLQTTPPYYLSGAKYYVNAGEVSNTGIDLGINGGIIQTRDWNWTTGINLSYMKNRVEKLTALEPVIYSGSYASMIERAQVVMEGEPIGTFWGYKWAGLDEETGRDLYYKADGSTTDNPQDEDRTVIGHASPKVTLGWNNTITWKNWSLNLFFNGAFGGQRINMLRYAMNTPIGNSRFVTDPTWLDELGKTMPDPSTVTQNSYQSASDKWVEKTDYWRLENVSLAYQFPKSQTHFADVRLSFSVQNAFTLTGYKGINPASLSFGDAEWQKGIDWGTAPAPRTFTFGVRFNL